MKGPLAALLDTSSDDSVVHSKFNTSHRPKIRYKSSVHICSLPKDVLLLLLSGLPLSDLVRLRRVNVFFHDLIDETPALWAAASLHSLWPTQNNFSHVQRAANCGNVEALLKLGVTYMYSECLPHPRQQLQITGEQAAEMFVRFEQLTPSAGPFTWVFYRPPWSSLSLNRNCCKSTVLQSLLNLAQNSSCIKSVYYCIGRTLYLFEDKEKLTEAFDWFKRAAQLGCAESAFMIWNYTYGAYYMLDKASELASVRALRNLVSSQPGCLDAQIMLCKLYAENRLGGLSSIQAANYVREFFLSSKPINKLGTFPLNTELTTRVRQILVDWLVEVSNLKHFSTEAVHLAVHTIDRYLLTVPSSKAELQLVGITALLLSTRFLGKDILTVREAAWVTDNTYQYEDVVHMMAQIVATLRGKFKVPTLIDFLQVLLRVASINESTSWMAQYFCDIVLLHTDFGRFSLSVIAASSLVLAGLVLKKDCLWNCKLQEFTGFSMQDLLACIALLHAKCSVSNELEDFKSRKLVAIALKYKQLKYCYVSDIPLISRKELQEKLEINDALYLKSLCSRWSIYEHVRATLPTKSAANSVLNKSICSGYEGDDELDCDMTESESADCNDTCKDTVDNLLAQSANIVVSPKISEEGQSSISLLETKRHQSSCIKKNVCASEISSQSAQLENFSAVSDGETKYSSSAVTTMPKTQSCAQNGINGKLQGRNRKTTLGAKEADENENTEDKAMSIHYFNKENTVVTNKIQKVGENQCDAETKGFTHLLTSANPASEGRKNCVLMPNSNVRVSVVPERKIHPLKCVPLKLPSSFKNTTVNHKRKSRTILENNSKTVIFDYQKNS